ncbi:MAG: hypothetical protein M3O02_11105 [Acidobacteriota bacterium]|nr:hypothetical protein [Acidobacteriota bacterium]
MPVTAEMSHELLRKAAFACLRRQGSNWNRNKENIGFGCSLVVSEIVSAAYEVPDAIGWRYGRSVLIECKVSRADFLADAKKPHRQVTGGVGERRYFLTPPGLLLPDELPKDWGLLELHGKTVELIYQPDWNDRELTLGGHVSEKRILLSLLARIKAREFLFIDRDDMDRELLEFATTPESKGESVTPAI